MTRKYSNRHALIVTLVVAAFLRLVAQYIFARDNIPPEVSNVDAQQELAESIFIFASMFSALIPIVLYAALAVAGILLSSRVIVSSSVDLGPFQGDPVGLASMISYVASSGAILFGTLLPQISQYLIFAQITISIGASVLCVYLLYKSPVRYRTVFTVLLMVPTAVLSSII